MKQHLTILLILIFQLSAQIIPNEYLVKSTASSIEILRSAKLQDIEIQEIKEISANNHIYWVKSNASLENIATLKEVSVAQHNLQCHYRQVPNDPFYNLQWQHDNTGQSGGIPDVDMGTEAAWDITTGGTSFSGRKIVVAVLDDGIDTAHVDLKANLWVNTGEIRDNGLDDDANGVVDDYFGYNSRDNNGDIHASSGTQFHGTRVAGMLGAVGNNGVGLSGINWELDIMPVYIGNGFLDNIIASYDYVLTQKKLWFSSNGNDGAYVVATNASFGWNTSFPAEAPLWCEMYDSLGKYGIVNAGATANLNIDVGVSGDLPTTCPSEHLITVTNINNQGDKVTNAGYGVPHIDLGAPGDGAYTTSLNNAYSPFSGTSGASPQVAGAIALAHAVPCPKIDSLALNNPALWSKTLIRYILTRTTPSPSLDGITTSGGYLHIGRLIEDLYNDCDKLHHVAEGVESGIVPLSEIQVQIFPNPTSNKVWVISELPVQSYDLWNIHGQLVLQNVMSSQEIDLSQLDNGLYYLTLKFQWGEKSYKILKQ